MSDHDPKPESEALDVPAARADGSEPALGRDSTPGQGADEDDFRQLLRGALVREPEPAPDVLSGVQRKLRQRSQGKFYADGWSTSRQPPIQTYLITSLVMLAFSLVVYAILSPLSGAAEVAEPPAPIQVIGPTSLPSAR